MRPIKAGVHAGKRRIRPTDHAADGELSSQEIGVLSLICGGNANKEIARRLSITEETVKGHMKSIFTKLGVHDRATPLRSG
jgi:DNA-binding NarL/FixJ family response regulator